jgi:TRAP-type C4-dicarboxylate transport system substrate-binding protein
MVRASSTVLVAVAVALLVGCSGSGSNKAGGTQRRKPATLTLADGETDVSNVSAFAGAVKQLSKGKLQIAIQSPWRPDDPRFETDLITDVEAGKAPLGIVGSRAFDTSGIDSFQALQAPLLIDTVELERRVLASDVTRKMLAGVDKAGLVGLALLPGPIRRPMGYSKPLLSVSDYRGARIGIRPSLVTAETLRALGATPVILPYHSSTSGLDGVEGHLAVIDSGFAERGAAITGNVDFEPRPNVIFANRRAFASLTAAQREVLLRAAAQAQATAAVWQADDGLTHDLCRRGVRIVAASTADLGGLQRAVRSVYRTLDANPRTKAFIHEVTSIRRGLGDSADVVSCRKTGTASANTTSVSDLNGKWEVTFTKREFIAAGADPGEICCGNWGRLTFVFDRGKWRIIGTTPGSSSAGTYVLHGSAITFYRSDHAYPGSDTEVWGPYTWSVYRDTLTFTKRHWTHLMGPTGLVVKPWRRAGR